MASDVAAFVVGCFMVMELSMVVHAKSTWFPDMRAYSMIPQAKVVAYWFKAYIQYGCALLANLSELRRKVRDLK